MGGQADVFLLDVSDYYSIQNLYKFIEKKFGYLDILVNSAGYAVTGKSIDITEEDFDKMNDINRIEEFLNEVPVFYLTTIDEGKPKCRPVGLHMLVDNKLYFGIGTFKDVYKQMQKNPNVEICACKDKEFLRYYGTAVFETNDRIANMAISSQPFLQQIYNETTGKKLGMFCLENAVAEFRTMMGIKESISFKQD